MFEGVKKAMFGRRGKPDDAAERREEGGQPAEEPAQAGETIASDPTDSEPAVEMRPDGEQDDVDREVIDENTQRKSGETGAGTEEHERSVEGGDASTSPTDPEQRSSSLDERSSAAETLPQIDEVPVANEDASESESERIIESLRREVAENYDKYLRAVAELENFRKRTMRERADLLRYAGENLARDILEVADNLERALAADSSAQEDFIKGIRLTYDRLLSILEQHGIKGEPAVGKPFDPTKHEALASVPTDGAAAGTVLDEFKKAYFFKDKLLRVAQVVVATASEAPVPNGADTEEDDGETGA